jgi:hypothetical protein
MPTAPPTSRACWRGSSAQLAGGGEFWRLRYGGDDAWSSVLSSDLRAERPATGHSPMYDMHEPHNKHFASTTRWRNEAVLSLSWAAQIESARGTTRWQLHHSSERPPTTAHRQRDPHPAGARCGCTRQTSWSALTASAARVCNALREGAPGRRPAPASATTAAGRQERAQPTRPHGFSRSATARVLIYLRSLSRARRLG